MIQLFNYEISISKKSTMIKHQIYLTQLILNKSSLDDEYSF